MALKPTQAEINEEASYEARAFAAEAEVAELRSKLDALTPKPDSGEKWAVQQKAAITVNGVLMVVDQGGVVEAHVAKAFADAGIPVTLL